MKKILKLITDNIDIWTSAENEIKSTRGLTSASNSKIYGIQKLRELILDLAITGNLTSENDNDKETNNILLDIELEIKNLTKKGLLGKRKILPHLNQDENLIKLPKNWVWTKLGNTGKIFSGNSINKNEKQEKYTNLKEGRPFIATKDVGYGQEKINYQNGILIPYNETKFKIAHKNAVLICSEGGSAGKKIGITEFDVCFGNKLIANETFSHVNPKYIKYIYQSRSFYKSFSKRMSGIIGGISMNEFLNIPVPIPPTKVQEIIVSKIDKLMKLCDKLEQKHLNSADCNKKLVNVLLDTSNQSQRSQEFKNSWKLIINLFDILFTSQDNIDELKKKLLQVAIMGKLLPQNPKDDPANKLFKKDLHNKKIKDEDKKFNIPKLWEWTLLGNHSLIERGGSPRPIKDFLTDDPSGINWIKISDTRANSKYILSAAEKIKKEGLKKTRMIYPGDFLLTNSMSFGRPYISKISGCIHDGWLRIHPDSSIDKNFLYQLLMSPFVYESFKKSAAGGVVQNLNADKVRDLVIPLPPLAEQKRISSKIDELMTLCESLKNYIQKKNLKKKQIADELISQALN